MNLEQKYGFRSLFNFVPEGDCRVPDELRHTLERAGFEIGVHGLEHDGKLYDSKAVFASKAVRIREYLQHWKASGFRSPLMQHRLSWLHQLGVQYDSSTFDTDPFEPQPDGVGTAFPFWVPGPNGTGYVELPYTLPQDFSLFVVLREQNINIWKRKLDWLVEHGGMALLLTHPDYMSFHGKTTPYEYPVSHYEEILRYIRQKYDGAFWNALPREVSRFYTDSLPAVSRNSRKKICMVAYTNYESDNRVRRYAEALVKRGDHVDVIAISEGNAPLGEEEISGVRVCKIQRRENIDQGKWTYAWSLLRFLAAASLLLARKHEEVGYDVIHVHNSPGFLVFSAWYPKWMGAKVILDIHEIAPELFSVKFLEKVEITYVKILNSIEKASADFADHVIIPNHLWQEKLISCSVAKEKCSVFMNYADSGVFYRRIRTRNDGRHIILFLGTFQ
ncbi:MAG: glycosyltransferase, partial [Nitrospiraceae bacterium]